MSPRTVLYVAAASAAVFAVGAFFTQKIEPGVTVSKVTVARDTPALRFAPNGQGMHPVALLAHGVYCSKEFLFCYGEALAHAGFDCYSVDLPGHGQSPHPFRPELLGTSLAEDARAVGPIDIFIGHSMGAYTGGQAVITEGFRPHLFIAIGAIPRLDTGAPPLLLMCGELDEFIRPEWVREQTNARTELFPHCDHLSELYDRRLINSAVAAACKTIGKTPPPPSTSWRWRVAGLLIGWLGTIGLATSVLRVPLQSVRWKNVRAALFSIVLIFGSAVVTQPWIGAMPHVQKLPWYLVSGIVFWSLATGLRRIKLPRWTLLAFAAVSAVAGAVVGAGAIVLLGVFFFLALLAGTACAAIAARRGSPRDGDITLAIFAGYAVGQWLVKFL